MHAKVAGYIKTDLRGRWLAREGRANAGDAGSPGIDGGIDRRGRLRAALERGDSGGRREMWNGRSPRMAAIHAMYDRLQAGRRAEGRVGGATGSGQRAGQGSGIGSAGFQCGVRAECGAAGTGSCRGEREAIRGAFGLHADRRAVHGSGDGALCGYGIVDRGGNVVEHAVDSGGAGCADLRAAAGTADSGIDCRRDPAGRSGEGDTCRR